MLSEQIKPIVIINSDFDKVESEIKKSNFENKEKELIPSTIFLEKYSIRDQTDPNLEKATSDLYNLEFYDGIMNDNTPYSGMPVSKS